LLSRARPLVSHRAVVNPVIVPEIRIAVRGELRGVLRRLSIEAAIARWSRIPACTWTVPSV
jgi:hypothetical protein